MTTPAKTIVLAEYIRQPETLARFTDLLGAGGNAYVQSVIIAASATDDLQKCTPQSVVRAALRAASLGLSCDPALKQAWLVPYSKRVKVGNQEQWVKEAQFQPHYKGLHTLAMRTNKYKIINVSPVYEGQRVMEDPLTGLHAVQEVNGFVGQPAAYNSAYTLDVTARRSSEQKRIGWLGYFETTKGYKKSVWMSGVEIDDHARKYVKDYEKNPNWNDNEKRAVMEMKTVLKQLLSWADLSGVENAKLTEAIQADSVDVIDAPAEEVTSTPAPVPAQMTYEAARGVVALLFDADPDKISREMLNSVYWSVGTTDLQQEAIRLILKEEYNAEAPEKPKLTAKETIKQLGY